MVYLKTKEEQKEAVDFLRQLHIYPFKGRNDRILFNDIKELVYKATFWTMQNYTEKEENANKYEKDLFEIFEKFNECVRNIQNDRLKI